MITTPAPFPGEHPVSCVIFDIDGTLTQTNDLIFASFNAVAAHFTGRLYSPAEIVSFFGPPEEGAIVRVVGEKRLDPAMDLFLNYYETHLKEMARLYPGIEELLQELTRLGVPLSVFTGKGQRTTLMTLEGLDIAGYFRTIVTGNDVVDHKPSGEGITRILQAVGCSADEALMVGDSVGDVKAAREAGVRIASAQWDSYAIERLNAMGLDLVFPSVASLRDWLLPRVRK
ncbi:MAG: phosphatase [Ignavibacteriales bacterium CG07_land_8_20_14_0_80_59_12]|nr:MAG: phosphatase [Ignavibacteriales bacterium CG07_land_8_20_14_0_80_59_12]